ncbi:MFS transporter [Cupriavidus basilensis]|uniref:MFS transporter n=1 Tax=Cupriavidus basilensis TaxID=68895 RepID=UPI0023E76D79|nr:MFS transporter [Cupriavidus basilensis]MDF3885791.1 MFS transporter [Cupriavidus basilensis]
MDETVMATGSATLAKHPDLSPAQVYLFAFTLGCATGVDFVASSMMGVAGTHIRGGIHASPEDFLWSLTSYAAAAMAANLVLRRIARDISYRGYTLLGLAIATVGAVLCTVCNTPLELSLARAVQGFGAGGLFTASRIIIQLVAAREERRPLFLGFNAGGMGLAALAPWLTAVLVEDASWRMIFAVQAGMSAAAILLVLVSYPRRLAASLAPWEVDIGGMDWITVILLGTGALVLLHGLGDLRFYELTSSPSVAITPLAGLALVAGVFIHQHRHPDPWLNPKLLFGRRYLVGLGFYTLYYFLNGLWGYVVPSMLQSGLGFTFQTAGKVLTITGLIGFAGLCAFTYAGTRLKGQRRYIALGYFMFAGAAWLLSQRMMPGASMAVLLPALTLQSLTTPFILALVAGLTYADFSVEDFAHAYQFKNIMRQIATAGGTGVASLWLQYGEALARTQLVARITPFDLPDGFDAATLTRWSALIDQQAQLIAVSNLFALLAFACVGVALVAVAQRALR